AVRGDSRVMAATTPAARYVSRRNVRNHALTSATSRVSSQQPARLVEARGVGGHRYGRCEGLATHCVLVLAWTKHLTNVLVQRPEGHQVCLSTPPCGCRRVWPRAAGLSA